MSNLRITISLLLITQKLASQITVSWDDVEEAELDMWAHLNIECDYRARYYLLEIINGHKKPHHSMLTDMWEIRIYGMVMGNHLLG